jgi:hypothetical protein
MGVSSVNSALKSGTSTMPDLFIRRAEPPFTAVPSSRMVPAHGFRKPARVSRSVVLPAPFGPSTASTFFDSSFRSMPRPTTSLP